MFFLISTVAIAILFYVYKFQFREISSGISFIVSSVEITVLSFLLLSPNTKTIILGIFVATTFYLINHFLSSFLEG